MASKTGWTPSSDTMAYMQDLFEARGSRCGPERRVTIRIDDAPLTMTRAELREKIGDGWNIGWEDANSPAVGYAGTLVVESRWLNDQPKWWWNRITGAQPPAALGTDNWIEIVEDTHE